MNNSISGGVFIGSAQHFKLSNVIDSVKKAIKKLIEILNQKGNPL